MAKQPCERLGLRGGRSFVDFGEDFADGNADRCSGQGEAVALERHWSALAVNGPDVARDGVDDPDGGHAHAGVLLHALEDAAEAILGGEDFDAEDGGVRKHRLDRRARGEHTNVRDADSSRAYPDPQLRDGAQLPLRSELPEDGGDGGLNQPVLLLTQSTLLNFTVDVIAIGAVHGMQVLLHRDVGRGGHGDSMTRISARIAPDLTRSVNLR